MMVLVLSIANELPVGISKMHSHFQGPGNQCEKTQINSINSMNVILLGNVFSRKKVKMASFQFSH